MERNTTPARHIDPHHSCKRVHRLPDANPLPRELPDELSDETPQAITSQLRILRSLPFTEFARYVADVLEAMGYDEVRLAGRTGYKGRNRDGGYDLTATTGKGTSRRRVIVQLKQFKLHKSFISENRSDNPLHNHADDRVYQRGVDELRGVALRAGAHEAILVTTGVFSSVVRENQDKAEITAPTVRLVDGAQLCSLLSAYRGKSVGTEADIPMPPKRGAPPVPAPRTILGESEPAGVTLTVVLRIPRASAGNPAR